MKGYSLSCFSALRRRVSGGCAHVIPNRVGASPWRVSGRPAFRSALIIGLTVSASLLLSAAWADQLVMKNSDRVTGSVVKQDGKTITVKTVNFGIVTAPWDQVASI